MSRRIGCWMCYCFGIDFFVCRVIVAGCSQRWSESGVRLICFGSLRPSLARFFHDN
jgi:hypothetical protein